MSSPSVASPPTPTRIAPSVPHVALAFWVVKVLTTGMGEAISDFLAGHSPLLAVGAGFVAFVTALVVQLRGSSYSPVRYWVAVAMVAVFGTMVADAVHVVLGVPYAVTTVGYLLAVLGCLAAWRAAEGSVSIHNITTRRRELFYWATVVATFALGTAAGDLTAFTLRLGYLASVLVFGALILVPLALWRSQVLGPVAGFWTAYVLTRPLGASVADWLGKPPTRAGGLGLGDGTVSVVALVLFGALVTWLQRSGADRPRADEPA